MDCREAREAIVESLDGRLPDALMKALDEHLASCHACRREAAFYAKLDAALSDEAAACVPDRLVAKVLSDARAEAASRRSGESAATGRRVVWQVSAAAAAAISILSIAGVASTDRLCGAILAVTLRPFQAASSYIATLLEGAESLKGAPPGVLFGAGSAIVAAALIAVFLLAVDGLLAARTLRRFRFLIR